MISKQSLITNWRLCILAFVPIIFSILPIVSPSSESKCAYVIMVMSIYWMTEALPLSVTALVPVFAFPLLGILSTDAVCRNYMKETNVMFLGGLTVAIAVEHSNLHRRISLFVMIHIGQSPRRLLAGFMLITMFLSMWISNTATTAMMVPIVEAVLLELKLEDQEDVQNKNEGRLGESIEDLNKHRSQQDLVKTGQDAATSNSPNGEGHLSKREIARNNQAIRDMYFLSVAYAANIGGTGSLTGTGPNVVVKDFLESHFYEPTGLNFGSWLVFNIPGMLICVLLAWAWLQLFFINIKKTRINSSAAEEKNIYNILLKKYEDLGKITHHEITVLTLFIILVILWLFRSPEFVHGWGDGFKYIFGDKFAVKDATAAIFIAFLLFVLPKSYSNNDPDKPIERCITWAVVEKNIPWGIILLLGGGFAMAQASKESGLSIYLGSQLTYLSSLHPSAIVFIVSLATAMITEVASNTATATIIIPILNELATGIDVNPLYLMLPAAISCSYAFMLPVATPPNAIVYGAANMKTNTMMLAGLVMNVLCVLVLNMMINTLGIAMFDLNTTPSWINSTIEQTVKTC